VLLCCYTRTIPYVNVNTKLVNQISLLFVDPENDPISLVAVIISDRLAEEELSINVLNVADSLTVLDQRSGLSLFSITSAPAAVFENAVRSVGYEISLPSM